MYSDSPVEPINVTSTYLNNFMKDLLALEPAGTISNLGSYKYIDQIVYDLYHSYAYVNYILYYNKIIDPFTLDNKTELKYFSSSDIAVLLNRYNLN